MKFSWWIHSIAIIALIVVSKHVQSQEDLRQGEIAESDYNHYNIKLSFHIAKELKGKSIKDESHLDSSLLHYMEVIQKGQGLMQINAIEDVLYLLEEYPYLQQSSNLMLTYFDLITLGSSLGSGFCQRRLASAYATGITSGISPMDAGKSLLLEYMGAMSGNPESSMALGYRHMYGIGVPEDCELALKYYEYSANLAASLFENRSYPLYSEKIRLNDIENFKNKGRRDMDSEMIDYYDHLSNDGDQMASITLGTTYLSGSRFVQQNVTLAMSYLTKAVKFGSFSAKGMLGYLSILGHFKLREGHKVNHFYNSQYLQGEEDSIELLKAASRVNDPSGVVGLAFAYYKGIGLQPNITKAIELFQSVAAKHADAGFFLGEIYMGRGLPPITYSDQPKAIIDPVTAFQFYSLSSSKGSSLALHRLSHMTATGVGVPRSCQQAVAGFKSVAERGDWMTILTKAHINYFKGDIQTALMQFSYLASIGVEIAQYNAAYILSKLSFCPPIVPMNLTESKLASKEMYFRALRISIDDEKKSQLYDNSSACHVRSLLLYRLSANQGNSESLLRIGDIYYYGLGGLEVDKVEAAKFYQLAADQRHPHAVFNLGIMHETGDGVVQDFHLAKRFYDQAATYEVDAQMPSKVALLLLQSHQSLHNYLGAAECNYLMKKLLVFFGDCKIVIENISKTYLQSIPKRVDKFVKTALPTRKRNDHKETTVDLIESNRHQQSRGNDLNIQHKQIHNHSHIDQTNPISLEVENTILIASLFVLIVLIAIFRRQRREMIQRYRNEQERRQR